ncbi:MAG: hypothetical protein PW843_12165 [Azospirillaceae bacterium]|nr:hypothetical protein [Azospirillaceae bacterium]
MIGKSTIVWLCLATVASGILYHTSYRVQEEQEHLTSLNRQIAQEQQSIQVLRAEWAYLNDPSRLERLTGEHTNLRPTKAEQMVALAAIPAKPEAPAAPADPATPAPKAPSVESTYVASAAPARPQVQTVALKAPAPKAVPVQVAQAKAPAAKPAERPAAREDSIGALVASLDAGKVTLASAQGKKAKPTLLVAEQTLSAKMGAAR